jgi:hypothetical protein
MALMLVHVAVNGIDVGARGCQMALMVVHAAVNVNDSLSLIYDLQ